MYITIININFRGKNYTLQQSRKYFPAWLRNQLISAGLEPVLSHAEKSYYRQFSKNIKIKIIN